VKPKVLIADDSALVLRMIEKMLAGAGYDVITARDGLEAIEKAVLEDVRLIILDVMMPRMNGYQACRLLKTDPSTRDLPVVILTSRDQAGDRFWGLETGADYYITKDEETHRILDLVKNILGADQAPPRARPADGQRSNLDILSRVNELLDRKLYEATILSEIGRVARNLVHFDETFTSVMGLVARVVDFTVGAMAFVEGDELDVVLMIHRHASPEVVEDAKARLMEAIARERKGVGLSRMQARLFAPADGSGGPEEHALGEFAAFPVVTNERLVGLLALGGKSLARMAPESAGFLGQLANQSYIVMENSRLFERVRNLSIRDGVTGLYNHRHILELLQREFDLNGRYQEPFSILMIDIDHFKKVNDAHGHPAGDAVLREVADVIQGCLRTVDAVGRYGGEEFVVILPRTPHDEAMQTAERVRSEVGSHVFRKPEGALSVTISVGVATASSSGTDTAEHVIREADKALYRAKSAGRDRTAGGRADTPATRP
jgi:two-component system cell cycle response regulator